MLRKKGPEAVCFVPSRWTENAWLKTSSLSDIIADLLAIN